MSDKIFVYCDKHKEKARNDAKRYAIKNNPPGSIPIKIGDDTSKINCGKFYHEDTTDGEKCHYCQIKRLINGVLN